MRMWMAVLCLAMMAGPWAGSILAQEPVRMAGWGEWIVTEIYLGRNIPAGGEVSEAQFAEYLDQVVTKEFPQGLTVFDAYGQMQKENGEIVRQKTKVIQIVHKAGTDSLNRVQGIINAYRKQFGKPQAIYQSSPTRPVFYGD